jgi:undecaprenyl-diphosphatase
MGTDAAAFRWFNQLADRTPWAHGPATAFAVYGIGVFAVLLVAAWWDARRRDDAVAAVASVAWAGLAALVGVALVQVIGAGVDRARPTTVLRGTHLLLDATSDFSFPSDHLTACSAVAVGLLLARTAVRRRWVVWAAVAATILMALDRVYVGAHYPGDVLGGMALGAAVAIALEPVGRRAMEAVLGVAAGTPLRVLVVGEGAGIRR